MATVTVTKQFKEDFDLWSADAIDRGEFTKSDMDEFKAMLRKDFQPGPDQLREPPARLDNYEDRIRVWSVFFADKADQIRKLLRKAA